MKRFLLSLALLSLLVIPAQSQGFTFHPSLGFSSMQLRFVDGDYTTETWAGIVGGFSMEKSKTDLSFWLGVDRFDLGEDVTNEVFSLSFTFNPVKLTNWADSALVEVAHIGFGKDIYHTEGPGQGWNPSDTGFFIVFNADVLAIFSKIQDSD